MYILYMYRAWLCPNPPRQKTHPPLTHNPFVNGSQNLLWFTSQGYKRRRGGEFFGINPGNLPLLLQTRENLYVPKLSIQHICMCTNFGNHFIARTNTIPLWQLKNAGRGRESVLLQYGKSRDFPGTELTPRHPVGGAQNIETYKRGTTMQNFLDTKHKNDIVFVIPRM